MANKQSDKGFPFRAIRYFTPKRDHTNGLLLLLGEKGKTLTEIENGWIKVALYGRQGWVPSWAIEIGHTRKYGDRAFTHDIAPIRSIGANLQGIAATNALEQVIRALTLAYYSAQESMPFLSQGMRSMLNDSATRDSYCNQLVNDLVPQYVTVVCNTQSTVTDLTSSLSYTALGDTRVGYYLRVTSNWKDAQNANKGPEIYTGYTGNSFGIRGEQHKNPSVNDRTPAANSVRASTTCRLYPISVTSGNAVYHTYGEQTLLLVNGTYQPIFRTSLQSATNDSAAMQQMVKTFSRIEVGKIFCNIGREVFKQLGFVPLGGRPGFGSNGGLNYESPMATSGFYEKNLWILTEQPGVKQVFHRTNATKAIDHSGTKSIWITTGRTLDPQMGGADSQFAVNIFKADTTGPPANADVYVVLELMKDQPHDTPWARLPDIGPLSDHDYANRLGIRIEWQDEEGQWYYRYIQIYKTSEFMPSDDAGCLKVYSQAMGLIRYISQITLSPAAAPTGPNMGWFLDYGTARVKKLTWDHMTQTGTLVDHPAPGMVWPPVTYKSPQQIAAELTRAGAHRVDGVFGSFGASNPKVKRSCDCCFIQGRFNVSTPTGSQNFPELT